MKNKFNYKFIAITCLFGLVSYIGALLFLTNTEPGWKMTRSYEKFFDKFSGCESVEGLGSPTSWYEIKVLNNDRNSFYKEVRTRNNVRLLFDGVLSYFYVPVVVINGYMPSVLKNINNLECWAKHGDTMSMFVIANYQFETYNIIKEGKFINSFDGTKHIDNYFEIRTYLDKMTQSAFLPFIIGNNLDSSCVKAYKKGFIICRKTFPEAFYLRARLECSKARTDKSLKYFKSAYRLGANEADFYLSKTYKLMTDEVCKS